MSKLRILILEDDPIIAETLALFLHDDDFEICATCFDPEEAFQNLASEKPDACLLDINLDSDKNGIDVAKYINQHNKIPFLFVTSYSDKNTLLEAQNVNPAGYIVKPFNKNTVCASLKIAISNHHKKFSVIPAIDRENINKKLLSKISEREFEILQSLILGTTNNDIALQFNLSLNTIKTHIKNIYLKMDIKSRYELLLKIQDF